MVSEPLLFKLYPAGSFIALPFTLNNIAFEMTSPYFSYQDIAYEGSPGRPLVANPSLPQFLQLQTQINSEHGAEPTQQHVWLYKMEHNGVMCPPHVQLQVPMVLSNTQFMYSQQTPHETKSLNGMHEYQNGRVSSHPEQHAMHGRASNLEPLESLENFKQSPGNGSQRSKQYTLQPSCSREPRQADQAFSTVQEHLDLGNDSIFSIIESAEPSKLKQWLEKNRYESAKDYALESYAHVIMDDLPHSEKVELMQRQLSTLEKMKEERQTSDNQRKIDGQERSYRQSEEDDLAVILERKYILQAKPPCTENSFGSSRSQDGQEKPLEPPNCERQRVPNISSPQPAKEQKSETRVLAKQKRRQSKGCSSAPSSSSNSVIPTLPRIVIKETDSIQSIQQNINLLIDQKNIYLDFADNEKAPKEARKKAVAMGRNLIKKIEKWNAYLA